MDFLLKNYNFENATLLLNGVGIFASVSIPLLLAIITYQLNKKSKAEEQLLQKKREVFEGFIKTLFDALDNEGNKQNGKINNKDLEKGMKDFKKNLILYASQETINANNKWITNYDFNTKMNIPDDKVSFTDIDYLLFCLRKEIGLDDNDYTNTLWRKFKDFTFYILKFDFIFGERSYSRLQTAVKDDLQIYLGKSIKLLALKIQKLLNRVFVFYLIGGLTSLIINSINMIRIMLKKEPYSYMDIETSFQKLEKRVEDQFKK